MPDGDRPRLCRRAGRDAWHIYFERRRISTGCTDRTEAETVLARFLAEHDKPPLAIVSIAAILARYLENRRERAIPGLSRLESAHKPLIRFWGDRPPEVVREAECRAYVVRRAAEHSGPHDRVAGPATARTELQALRAALRWAEAEELIAKAPKLTFPARAQPRERWLTRAEAERLLAACKAPHVRLFTLVALNTAARKRAILDLTWQRVDLKQQLIEFRVPGSLATRKRRVAVPINDTLLAALVEANAMRVSQWVVEYGASQVGDLKHAFARACVAAKLSDVTPHTLRHTAATWMVQAGISLWEVAGMLGNTVEMVEDTYAHHSPTHLRNASRALG